MAGHLRCVGKTMGSTQFPIEDIRDPLTRETRDHEAFAETRRRTYIGRPGYFETLDRHAAGDGAPLVLLGDSGSGKSALLANWLDHWREVHPNDFIFQHYIGATPGGAGHWQLMTRLIAEIKRWTGDSDEMPRSRSGLLRDFPLWLAKARLKAEHNGVRFIVVLDALNQLEDRKHARLLGWLPSHPFTGPLRLIVSTLPGDSLEALEKRGWVSLRVEPLTLDERRRMITDYLTRFGKTIDVPWLDRLAVAPAAANPLYLKILLDELRVTGSDERLDECLGNYLAAPDIPSLLKQVLARYQRDYERDRPGLVGEAFGLIWAARRGLSETELLRLLKPADLPQLPLATWSPLRAALEEGLVDRDGILNFAHDSQRAAVETAFAPDEDRRDELRLHLADDFERQPISSRSCDELPWLLLQTESYQRLRHCLLDIDRFLEINKRDKEELRRYWVHLGKKRTMDRLYLASFEHWSKLAHRDENRISYAANELCLFLNHSGLYAEAEPLIRSAIDLEMENPGSNHQFLAICLSNLASLLESMNRLEEVEGLYRRALSMSEQSFGPEHPQVAICLSNLSGFLLKTNRLDEGERLFRRALATDEKCLGRDHPDVAGRLDVLAGLLQRTNRLDQAEAVIRRSLAILESSFGPDHPNVATGLSSLALVLHKTNRLAEAEPLVRRVLAIDEKNYGPEHMAVARDLNNLAGLLEYTDRPAGAEPLYRRAQAIFEKNLDVDHPDVGTSLNNLAQALRKMNRLAEAEPILLRAVQIFLKFTRATHQLDPRLQMAINNYGGLLEATGRSMAQIDTALHEIAPELYRRVNQGTA
jgi:tetratricopeptide (TPR) repeat protein